MLHKGEIGSVLREMQNSILGRTTCNLLPTLVDRRRAWVPPGNEKMRKRGKDVDG